MESWGQLHLFEGTSPSSSKCLACCRCSGLQQREADGILRQKTLKQLKQLIKLSADQETNWQPDKFLSGSLLISFHTLLCANYLLGTVSTGWEWRKPDCAGCPSGQANGCWQRLTAQLLSPRVSQQPYIWLFRPRSHTDRLTSSALRHLQTFREHFDYVRAGFFSAVQTHLPLTEQDLDVKLLQH